MQPGNRNRRQERGPARNRTRIRELDPRERSHVRHHDLEPAYLSPS